MLRDYSYRHLLDDSHHSVHHWVSEIVSYLFLDKPLDDFRITYGIGSSSPIGNDKPPSTEVDTTIVTNDDN